MSTGVLSTLGPGSGRTWPPPLVPRGPSATPSPGALTRGSCAQTPVDTWAPLWLVSAPASDGPSIAAGLLNLRSKLKFRIINQNNRQAHRQCPQNR